MRFVELIILVNKQIFEEAVEIYLENCSYNEFFVSGVYNVMAEQGKKSKVLMWISMFRLVLRMSLKRPRGM